MSQNELLLLRHATAGGAGAGVDFDRRLTETGLAEARNVGRRLAERSAWPDRVLCSDARRCQETWVALASSLKAAPSVSKEMPSASDVYFERRLYNAPADTLLDILSEQVSLRSASEAEPRVVRTLLIAHNPGISHLAYALGRGDPVQEAQLQAGFAPAALATFRYTDTAALGSPAGFSLLSFERP